MTKLLRFFRPSHQHTAFSATVLLMAAVMLSRVVGYIREAYIAYAFGAGPQTDAYVAAFTLPDWLNYIVAGGAASITFISIYTRFLAEKRDADAQENFLRRHYRHVRRHDRRHHRHRNLYPAICALDVPGLLAGAGRTHGSPHPHSASGADFLLRRRSRLRRSCSPTACFFFPLSVRCSTTC